jgi:hypothetical protein
VNFFHAGPSIQDNADDHSELRAAIRELCAQFPDEYFRKVDAEHAYPEAFVDALMRAGWLAAMIPEEYGGSGLGLTAASVIMEEINRNGGNAGAVHGQMYNMGTLLRNGSEAQKQRYLPAIAAGELRIQSMAFTEPTTGTPATSAFCTISNPPRPLTNRICSDNGTLPARTACPTILSTALWRPTSSRTARSMPFLSNSAAACNPPVRSNSACAGRSAVGKDVRNSGPSRSSPVGGRIPRTRIVSIDAFPQMPQLEAA